MKRRRREIERAARARAGHPPLTLIENGRQLRYDFTLEDPVYLTAPVSASMVWDHRPDLEPSIECEPAIARRFLDEARLTE